MDKCIVVKKSNLHGKGVFASCDIRRGKKIIQYTGKIVSKKEGTRISEAEDKKGLHTVFSFNRKFDIVGALGGNEARYINASKKGNCEAVNYYDKEVWIVAARNISKGEELLYDYGFSEDHWD